MTWNPFDWTAGPFLFLYVTLAAVIFVSGFILRSAIGPAGTTVRKLNVLELACLAGGAPRVGDAILLSLMAGNGAAIDSKDSTITVTNQTPLATLLGQSTALAFQPGMTRTQFQTAVTPVFERIRTRLQQLGYVPTDVQMTSFVMTMLPFVGLLLVFGIIKVVVGAERHHPVGILVVLLFFTAFAGFLLTRPPKRTRAGNDALQTYQSSHARASRAPLDNELLLAVALSGAVVLSGTAYAPVYAASRTMSGGSDGGSGCGGGGGGGGGCGGCSA